ncbi:MAG: dialkylresorcinol condensing enzyme [Aliivibrio sp.]|uniref:dialkylrecorsinol condensing enzyme n=1 Tax=Aliivibrio sp. TaxID=1872443 RepID=UPI001A3900D3|nr:dialkylresorcinol condensing enzyme [Aliivibrio sp.]
MKKVLVLFHSQSGQLESYINSSTEPLRASEEVKIDYFKVEPIHKFPYPWSFYSFFDAFPEAIYMNGCEIKPLDIIEDDYDLIIIGYTVWFLAPSIPMTGFLKSAQAKRLMKDKPVITLIACRDMWVMAQEKMKVLINNVEGTLIDNAVLTDQGGSIQAFVTTPRWLFTGKKDPFWIFPAAGVSEEDISNSRRFGERLVNALQKDEEKAQQPLLKNLGAVSVNGKLVGSEKVGTRSFMVWGKLIQKSGKPGSMPRKLVITLYAVFLVILILTVVPLNLLIKKLINPFRKKAIEQSIKYYEEPSGR